MSAQQALESRTQWMEAASAPAMLSLLELEGSTHPQRIDHRPLIVQDADQSPEDLAFFAIGNSFSIGCERFSDPASKRAFKSMPLMATGLLRQSGQSQNTVTSCSGTHAFFAHPHRRRPMSLSSEPGSDILKGMAEPLLSLIYPSALVEHKSSKLEVQPLTLPVFWLPVAKRIRALKELARKEVLPFSEGSERGLLMFLASLPFTRPPSIFLLDNGNLRILWKSPSREQIALQFLDETSAQFVFFYKREAIGPVYASHGRDNHSGIISQIHALGLSDLLFKESL